MTNSIGTSLAPHLMRIERQINAIDRRLLDLTNEIDRRGGAEAAKDFVPPEKPQIIFETTSTATEKPSDVARRIAAGMLASHTGPVSHAELVSAVFEKLNGYSESYAANFKKNPNRILERIPNIRKYKDGSWQLRKAQ